MKKSPRAALSAFAVSCVLVTVPAFAAPLDPMRESLSVHVPYRDLDLRSAAGRQAFERRVRRAAYRACTPRGSTLDMRLDAQRCMAEMRQDAATQVAALMRDDGTRLASR